MGIESSHDFDEIVNQHEEKLFEWKQDVLQKYMVPSLLRSKQKMLSQLISAEQSLSLNDPKEQPNMDIPTLVEVGKIELLESYERGLSHLKLQLMNVVSFKQLEQVLLALTDWQEEYMNLFTALFNEYSEALPEEVNSREIIDTGKLLLALKQNQIDNKMSWAIEREISRIKKLRGTQASKKH